MNIIEAIKKNREAGTPGPWKYVSDGGYHVVKDDKESFMVSECYDCDDDVDMTNAARIARVPELEEIALAAAELVEMFKPEDSKSKLVMDAWFKVVELDTLLSK